MTGVTSAFSNQSLEYVLEERSKDITLKGAKVLYCRVRGGWQKIGGGSIKHRSEALLYAEKISRNAEIWEKNNVK